MKKIIALLLAAGMVVSVCGCEKGEQKPTDSKTEITSETEKKPETNKGLTLGTYEEKIYENSYAKLGFNLPENFRFYSYEELKAMNQVSEEMTSEDYFEFAKTAPSFYDMTASSSVEMENVNVSLERSDTLPTPEEMKAILEEAMGTAGYQNVKVAPGKATFDGKEVDVVYVSYDMGTYHFEQLFFPQKAEEHIVTIAVTASEKDRLQALLDCFYQTK